MKKIVVGYDATSAAEHALIRAAELAKDTGAEVLVASVTPVLRGAGRGMGPYDPADSPELHQAELQLATKKLRELGVEAKTVNGMGDPATRLVELADAQHADLLVVGATRHPWLKGLLGIAVSERVSHRAHTDVLVVH